MEENQDYLISNFANANAFIKKIKEELGIQFKVYINGPDSVKEDDHTALQIGTELHVNVAKAIVKITQEFYSRLEYVSPLEGIPRIYIGSSTKDAEENGYTKLIEEFDQLLESEDKESFHGFIRRFS